MCGLFGLKPTYGAVSRYGAMPRAWSLDTVGPLTRSAVDAALIYAAIAGYDPKDPTTSRRAIPDWRRLIDQPLKGLKLAHVPGEPFGAVDAETHAAHMAALLGAHIIKVKPPTDHIEQDEARKVYEAQRIDISTLSARIAHVVQSSFAGRRIVVFSGGAAKGTDGLLAEVRQLRDGGASGSIIGRNSFQRSREDALDLLGKIVDIYKGKG